MGRAIFPRAPRPDPEVVAVLERALESAKQGNIRLIAITAVGPVQQIESVVKGDFTPIRGNALLGGVVQLTTKLIIPLL